ncbi:MAG TPA: hypothetical protein VF006_03895 [Longimicrobium sp.]
MPARPAIIPIHLIMHVIHSIALAAVLAIPTATLAQPSEPERVRPGTMLDTTFIRGGTDFLAILIDYEGDTMRIGTAVLETRIDSMSGARHVTYVQRLLVEDSPSANETDSMHLDWGTLLPISAHRRGHDPRDYVFESPGVRILSLRDSTTYEEVLHAPVFYVAIGPLLRALPLRAGYHAVLPVLPEDGGAGEMHVTVTREAHARALDGAACPSFVVEVQSEPVTGTFHLSTADRSVVRFDAEYTTLVRPAGCP